MTQKRGDAARTPAGGRIATNPDGGQPAGDLPGPFFGRQGDEQRDPTPEEKEALARTQRELPPRRRQDEERDYDSALADSFPASDPPASAVFTAVVAEPVEAPASGDPTKGSPKEKRG